MAEGRRARLRPVGLAGAPLATLAFTARICVSSLSLSLSFYPSLSLSPSPCLSLSLSLSLSPSIPLPPWPSVPLCLPLSLDADMPTPLQGTYVPVGIA